MRSVRHLVLLLVLATPASYAQEIVTPPAAESSPLVIEGIECKGNSSTSCDFIRRKLRLQIGTEVENDAVRSAELRLSALSNFQSVRVYLEKGSSPGKVILVVEVVEASAFITELVGTYSYNTIDYSTPYIRDYDSSAETLTGRISHQNLFGRQKIAELLVSGAHSGDSQSGQNSRGASLVYIDPDLFGSERLFWSASVRYSISRAHSQYDGIYYDPPTSSYLPSSVRSESSSESIIGAASIGYRLWEFSYLFGGYNYQELTYRQELNSQSVIGSQSVEGRIHADNWLLGYGWDSEDDAYFPTRGSRFSATAGYYDTNAPCSSCAQVNWNAAYKISWMMGAKSVWTANVGGEPATAGDRLRPIASSTSGSLSLSYSRLMSASDALGGISRGRWYIQAGVGPFELRNEGRIGGGINQARLALGIRLESKTLGMIELYAAANRFWPNE